MIVTVVCYSRPSLLKRCLESIRAADLTPVDRVIVSCDWHSETMYDAMREVWSAAFSPRFPSTIIKQRVRLGIHNHQRLVFNSFADAGTAGSIVALEEDSIVAPDAFLFAHWALRQPGYQFANLGTYQQQQPQARPDIVHEDWELRASWGWAFTLDFWHQIEPLWNGKVRQPYGWDWSLTYHAYWEGWRCLTPEVARVANTGREGGVYQTADEWDETHAHTVLCDTIPSSYQIVKHDRPEQKDWPGWVQLELLK